MYVVGFTDKSGQWYMIQNKDYLNLIPGATVLNFTDDYHVLVGGFMNVGDLNLGRDTCLMMEQDPAKSLIVVRWFKTSLNVFQNFMKPRFFRVSEFFAFCSMLLVMLKYS